MIGRGTVTPEEVRDETADTVDDDTDTIPDDGLMDTCVECGMTNGECAGDCLYAN